MLCWCCRPKSPEDVESVLNEKDDHYDEETRRVKFIFCPKKRKAWSEGDGVVPSPSNLTSRFCFPLSLPFERLPRRRAAKRKTLDKRVCLKQVTEIFFVGDTSWYKIASGIIFSKTIRASCGQRHCSWQMMNSGWLYGLGSRLNFSFVIVVVNRQS